MITVTVSINCQPIITRSAVNKSELKDGYCRYLVDDGTEINHMQEDGAVKLAIKMLRGVKKI